MPHFFKNDHLSTPPSNQKKSGPICIKKSLFFCLNRLNFLSLLGLTFLFACSLDTQVDQENHHLDNQAMGSHYQKEASPSSLTHQSYAAQVCADGPTTFGIDVSSWQGDVDWDQVASDGVKYAVIRVSSGLHHFDQKFDQNWSNAGRVGILRGVYQYFRPAHDARQQAELLVNEIRRVGGSLELPPVIDVEEDDGHSAEEIQQAIRVWIEVVEEELGITPMIYTGFYFWQDHVGGTSEFNSYPLWHPQYAQIDCPRIADAWPDWHFWQYSCTGRVAGIEGDVDLNHFNGSYDDLLAFSQSLPNRVWAGQPRNQSFPLASQPPLNLCVGERLEGEIWINNSGNQGWDQRVYLAPTPRDQDSPLFDRTWVSPTRITPALDLPIDPNTEGTFRFIIRGNEVGEQIHTFGLLAEEETWFADSGGPQDDYLALNVSVNECVPDLNGEVVEVDCMGIQGWAMDQNVSSRDIDVLWTLIDEQGQILTQSAPAYQLAPQGCDGRDLEDVCRHYFNLNWTEDPLEGRFEWTLQARFDDALVLLNQGQGVLECGLSSGGGMMMFSSEGGARGGEDGGSMDNPHDPNHHNDSDNHNTNDGRSFLEERESGGGVMSIIGQYDEDTQALSETNRAGLSESESGCQQNPLLRSSSSSSFTRLIHLLGMLCALLILIYLKPKRRNAL